MGGGGPSKFRKTDISESGVGLIRDPILGAAVPYAVRILGVGLFEFICQSYFYRVRSQQRIRVPSLTGHP